MTKDTKSRAVEQLDLTKPIWWVFYQTASSRVWQEFLGEGAKNAAIAHAKERAATLRRQIAVFPPQVEVRGPISEPTEAIPLTFGTED